MELLGNNVELYEIIILVCLSVYLLSFRDTDGVKKGRRSSAEVQDIEFSFFWFFKIRAKTISTRLVVAVLIFLLLTLWIITKHPLPTFSKGIGN
jgi:hypothetical protein